MTTLLDVDHWLAMSKMPSPKNGRFTLRRTPRRKLVFSSSDDEADDSPQSISSVHILRQEHHSIFQDEQLSSKAEMTTSLVTRTKLEHYGFSMLARPASIHLNKRQSLGKEHQNKRICSNESRHSMQTRSQLLSSSSSSDVHSDQLVNLFDKTLSTVTPNPVRHRSRRLKPLPLCLSDNEKMPVLTVIPSEENSNVQKRSFDEEENSDKCRSIKRTKVFDEHDKENSLVLKRPRRGVAFMRSLTEPTEEQLKASVELGSNRDLIGDRSRPYLLPRCPSRKHPDLACINPQTLIDVLDDVYASEIENLHVIDCRYPYEYEGGHIQSAQNLYTRSQVFEQYFRKPLELKDPTKRNIFIFHCEFSSERAPSLLRYFRAEDRTMHEKNYPQLHYPEVYLLEGGYKGFFEYSKEFCVPNEYRTMVDAAYQEQYRQYRFETKQFDKFTGTNERTGGGRRTRVLTFRSCLSFSSQLNQAHSANLRDLSSPS